VNAAEFKAMQRRFQSTVLGLLAIEQLTTPVVAGQALLASTAAASAGAGAGDAAVTSAQQRVDTQKDKVTQAQNTLATKTGAVDKDLSDIADNNQKISDASKDGGTVPASLLTTGKDLSDKLRSDKTEAENAKRSVTQEEETLKEDQAALAEAKSRSASATTASGQLGEIARSNTAASETMGRTIRDIVDDINASYTRDECIEFLHREYPEGLTSAYPDLEKDARMNKQLKVCEDVVRAGIRERSLQLNIRLKELELGVEGMKSEARKMEIAQPSAKAPPENGGKAVQKMKQPPKKKAALTPAAPAAASSPVQ
jgi:hypothetical protein